MSKKRSAVLAVLAFGALGALLVIGLISRSVRSSEEYLHALTFCTHAPAVVADLGEPIADGLLPSVKRPMSANATANVWITLKGPKGNGTASLTEVHEKHGWRIVRASWTYEGATKDLGTEPSP